MPKNETKVSREISKEKFKRLFLNGLDADNPESISIQFEKIENNIIKYIGDSNFKERYKNAIITFGDWYIKKYDKKEIEDFYSLDYFLSMPLILAIYFELIEDNIYLSENEPWDKYIKMFNDGYEPNVEKIVSQIAYINSYYSLREEREDVFWERNIEPLTIFLKWFASKHSSEKVDYAISDCWMGDVPYIFSVVEDYMAGPDEDISDEEIAEMVDDIEKKFKDLSFSKKKNINILADYVLDLVEDRTLFICPLETQPMEPIPIPAFINKDNEKATEEFDFISRTLRGYLACLLEDNGIFIIAHMRDEKTQVLNGFFFVEGEIHCLDVETLADTISIVPNDGVVIVYEVADILFVN